MFKSHQQTHKSKTFGPQRRIVTCALWPRGVIRAKKTHRGRVVDALFQADVQLLQILIEDRFLDTFDIHTDEF